MKKINSKLFRLVACCVISIFTVAAIAQATTTIGANISSGGTLTITGATVLNGGLTMDTNKFTVADTSGNTAVGGTLAVTGATTLTGALGFGTASSTAGGTDTLKVANIQSTTGAISFSNENLTTTGAINFATASSTGTAALDSLTVGGGYGSTGATISTAGVLQINGAATLGSTLAVTGATTLTGALGFDSASSTAGGTDTLKVANIQSTTGAISFSNENLTTTGAVNFATASSTGTAALDSLTVGGGYGSTGATISTAGVLQIDGAATLASTLAVTGATTLTGATDAGTFTQGGGVRATSTVNAAETLLASDFDVENYIAYTSNVQSMTLTLPATSTLSSFIPNAGDSREIILENATSTAAINITIAAGAGMDLQEPDGENVIIGTNNYALIKFFRRSDTDMVVIIEETIPAD